MDSERIGKIIKKIRLKNNLTQAEFAKELGVTYQAVSKWENGKNIPDIAILKNISEKYDISILSLLNTTNKKKFNKKIIIIIILVVIFLAIYFIDYHKHDFEFKTITSNCSEFNISGSLAYNHDRTAIYISNINYCGGDDINIYTSIECTLYKISGNVETKLASSVKNNSSTTLDSYLQDIKFNIDSKTSDCKILSESKIMLNIKATKDNGEVINYDIPLNIDSTCKN